MSHNRQYMDQVMAMGELPYDMRLEQKVARLKEENAQLKALAEKLKLEAQIQAQEARTANATIYEIYQVVSGGKGEPGNWCGAKPVAHAFNHLKAELAQAQQRLERMREFITLLTTREPDHLSPLDYQRHYVDPSNP